MRHARVALSSHFVGTQSRSPRRTAMKSPKAATAEACLTLEQLPNVGPFGEPRNCRACTRRGTPCQREPLPGRDYCPSHKHLEEFDVEPQVTADAANSQQVAAAA